MRVKCKKKKSHTDVELFMCPAGADNTNALLPRLESQLRAQRSVTGLTGAEHVMSIGALEQKLKQ